MARNYDGNTRPHWSIYDFLVSGAPADIKDFPGIVDKNKYLSEDVFGGKKIQEVDESYTITLYSKSNKDGVKLPSTLVLNGKPCCEVKGDNITSIWSFTEKVEQDEVGHIVYELNKLNENTPEQLEKIINDEYAPILARFTSSDLPKEFIDKVENDRAAKIIEAKNAQALLGVTYIEEVFKNKFTFTVNPLMIASQQKSGNSPTFREGPRVDYTMQGGKSLNIPTQDKNHLVRIGIDRNLALGRISRTLVPQAHIPRPLARLENEQNPTGKGVTVVILDSSPTNPQEVFAGGKVNYWADLASDYFKNHQTIPRTKEEKEDKYLQPPILKSFPDWGKNLKQNGVRDGEELDHDDMQKYHGLLVASLVRQVAPEATIVLLRVLNDEGEAPNTLVIAALNLVCKWADKPPKLLDGKLVKNEQGKLTNLVINLSLGAYESMVEIVDFEDYLIATNCLCKKGAIIVASAGNFSFTNHPFNPWEPAAFGFYDDTPALNSNLITVAATSDTPTEYAWFSNEGNLGAPGLDIMIDLGAPVTTNRGNFRLFKWSGTSFAAPLVAGAAALLLDCNVASKNVKTLLWKNATKPHDWNGIRELNLYNALNGLIP